MQRIIIIGYMGAGKTTVGKALAKDMGLTFYDLDCGGGTPCFFDNIDYMNSQGTTFYLKATPDVLYKHLKMGKSVRPLLLNKTPDEVRTFIEAQLAQREPFYNKAKYAIDVNLMDTYDKIKLSVDKIKNKIEEEKA